MRSLTRDVTSPNLQTVSESPPIMRSRSPYGTGFLHFPPVTGQREPGTAYMTIWTAPDVTPGMSNPRMAGTRTKR